jgi:hypothetical protein
MINYTSKTDSLVRSEALLGKPLTAHAAPQRSPETDRLSSASQEVLQTALVQQPEIRPEAVQRGRELLVDANYPPKEIIRQLSELLVKSADLSEKA